VYEIMLESCSDYCGYVAAIIGALAFGSFGVPIKYVSNLNVDPLVMQTYKSVVCFLTCWLVVFVGEPIKFTYWGIISGLFWVPGATAGIVGIRQAGLAISVGMWSSLNVISSFCWGLGVFHERVKSVHGSLRAAFILILGLMGMAYYSSPVKESHQVDKHDDEELKKPLVSNSLSLPDESMSGSEDFEQVINSNIVSSNVTEQSSDIELTSLDKVTTSISAIAPEAKAPVKIIRRKKTDGMEGLEVQTIDDKQVVKDYESVVFGSKFKMTKRQVGLVGAAINGIWGSNSLIPLHYARYVVLGANDQCYGFILSNILITQETGISWSWIFNKLLCRFHDSNNFIMVIKVLIPLFCFWS
jgi:hypothetical protein